MWGSDYPHDEGTFPFTREHLRQVFSDRTEEVMRDLLANTAADLYGFDLAKLAAARRAVRPDGRRGRPAAHRAARRTPTKRSRRRAALIGWTSTTPRRRPRSGPRSGPSSPLTPPRRASAEATRWPTTPTPRPSPSTSRSPRPGRRRCSTTAGPGITWPKEYGGRGGTIVEQMIFNQELANFDVPGGVFAQGIGMAGPDADPATAPSEQKERFLRPMLRGDELWCQLFSEPGAGSDLAALATQAVHDGDEYVVNGQKVWTSSAHYSDWGILLARTDPRRAEAPAASPTSSSTCARPGIDIRPLRQITGTAHFNEVFLTDVRIPADQRGG